MKKSNLIKAFSILILSIVVISICTMVNAADANGYNDLSATLTGNAAGGNNTNTGNTNNSNVNGVNTNVNANKANTNNTNKANNASVYNNTNLPKTGIESSLPVAALVVVFGISAVYAYKKIKDYRNI